MSIHFDSFEKTNLSSFTSSNQGSLCYTEAMNKILLATDLDGTLVGDDSATGRLNEIVKNLQETRGLKFAYVTGRSPELFTELKNEKLLLEPDALVTAVGTEIYIDGEKLAAWPNVSNWDLEQMKTLLTDYPSLKLQPITEQREYKLSYFLKDNDELVEEIRERLKDYPVNVVYSMSLYLDILPTGVNKGSALQFLANMWDIDREHVYACGDSGNDIDMLACSNAIIVGNAKKELLDWAAGRPGVTYEAKANYANGIIEGLGHYSVIGQPQSNA